jgi:L,D-transpeptidase YcbB
MTKPIISKKAALFAVGAAALLCVAGPQPSQAQFLSGLSNWLSGNGNGNNGHHGFFFRHDNTLPPSGQGDGDGSQPVDPFQAAWISNPKPGYPTLLPENIKMTQQTINQYQDIVARGGWPRVPEVAMGPDSRGQAVVILHQRLAISGDLVGRSVPDEYDPTLVRAVQKFQIRHGLPPTGTIDRPTMDALNVTAATRLQQLQASLARMQQLMRKVPKGRYVLVNLPAAQAEAVDHNQVIQRHTVVVGKAELPTPTLESKITDIDFNPFWHVPKSIIQTEVVAKARQLAQQNVNFLDAYHMQAFDSSGQLVDPHSINWFSDTPYTYSYRQLPWEQNSLGFVKINFANKYAVYMHDTPEKSFFTQDERYESHGCVRVHDVDQLVAWLLEDNPGWDLQRVDSFKHNQDQPVVPLKHPVPVLFVYIDAWTTPDGVTQFRPDMYNLDGGGPETASAN